MEFKGTKGEWTIQEIENTKLTNIKSNKSDWFVAEDVLIKDAQLIATAPKLLKDLIDLVWLVEKGATSEEITERILE